MRTSKHHVGSGNGLEQFKKAGAQAIVYPSELASGKLQFPYSEGR